MNLFRFLFLLCAFTFNTVTVYASFNRGFWGTIPIIFIDVYVIAYGSFLIILCLGSFIKRTAFFIIFALPLLNFTAKIYFEIMAHKYIYLKYNGFSSVFLSIAIAWFFLFIPTYIFLQTYTKSPWRRSKMILTVICVFYGGMLLQFLGMHAYYLLDLDKNSLKHKVVHVDRIDKLQSVFSLFNKDPETLRVYTLERLIGRKNAKLRENRTYFADYYYVIDSINISDLSKKVKLGQMISNPKLYQELENPKKNIKKVSKYPLGIYIGSKEKYAKLLFHFKKKYVKIYYIRKRPTAKMSRSRVLHYFILEPSELIKELKNVLSESEYNYIFN